MSAPPGPLDVRRLLTRFIVLVVVPALGLIGFGVVAISNERAVVEKRFGEEYLGRLRAVAASLASGIDEAAAEIGQGDVAADPIVSFSFRVGEQGLEVDREIPALARDALEDALQRVHAPPEGSVALVPVPSGPARGLYAVRGDAQGLSGIAFSDSGLSAFVEREGHRLFPNDVATWTLSPPPPAAEPSTNPMRRVLDEITQARADSGTMSLPLPGPLADWRIVAQLPGDDPVSTALWRNRTIYIVALSIFYIVIAIGVVVTLRGIAREARLSRMKTDFVSNISHELRTPLTSIRMFAETLRLGRAASEAERNACLDIIIKESERLSVLTDRTLEWGRLEAGRRHFVREPISVRALVEPVVEGLVTRGVLRPEELTLDLPANLPEVYADPGAMDQVLANLLENAAKYSGDDRRIQVRARRGRRRVHLDVVDNGIGIARRDLKKIFERFYRADDLLARTTEGSGLGLSIARRIVDAHGGRLTVKSRPGQGSTFSVELPAAGTNRAAAPARNRESTA